MKTGECKQRSVWWAGWALFLAAVALRGGECPPNVVLMMADDMGWGDVGFNGNAVIQTPELDRMAKAGLRFDRFYAHPTCSPTRGAMLTGRHPWRYGIYQANVGHLREGERTLYEVLKSAGYRTGHFGKWHLGTLTAEIEDANRGREGNWEEYSPPWRHGVDEAWVTESKVPTYDPMYRPLDRGHLRNGWSALEAGEARAFYGTRYWRGEGEPIPIDAEVLSGDDSRIVVNAALPFIRESVAKGAPFVATLWFHAPHLPVVADESFRACYPDASDFEKNYYGCITALDEQVGRVREELRRLGVAGNTLVIFCSDNGPQGALRDLPPSPGSTGGLRGRKGTLYEGGIRVPAVMEWPAVIPPGETVFPAGVADIFPTLLTRLGLLDRLPSGIPLDGIDLSSVWEDPTTRRPSPIAFQTYRAGALSDNRYKAYFDKREASWALYDLIEDRGETNDLAQAHPEVLEEMIRAWESWQRSCEASDAGADY